MLWFENGFSFSKWISLPTNQNEKNDDFSGTFKRLSTHRVILKPAVRMANVIYDTAPKDRRLVIQRKKSN